MIIGILTFHRAYNYGAVLQCYALQKYLQRLGYEVSIIDYRQPWTESLRETFSIGKIRQLFRHPFALWNYFISWRKRKKCLKQSHLVFDTFLNKYLNISNTCYNSKDFPIDYDCYFIGSDQLWSVSCLGGKLDEIYLANFPHKQDAKVIGYAISTSNKSFDKLEAIGIKNIIQNFSYLSFREESVSLYINTKYKRNFQTCVDPTILCDRHIWDKLINEEWSKKNYILIYEARDAVDYPNLINNKAKELSIKVGNGCNVVNLSNMQYHVDDFISAFVYAQCVITTSFHATVFSVIFNKPFYSIKLNDGADSRYENLLIMLGLSKQCVSPDFIPSIPFIDYEPVLEKLNLLRKTSEEFLKTSLL